MDFNKFLAKLKLDAHHGIERFGILCCVMLLLTAVLMTTIVTHKSHVDKNSMTNKAVYTSEFTSSLTKTHGEVVNVFRNEAMTDAFALIKFDNTESISTDAKDYQMFLTGSNISGDAVDLQSQPAAVIYMFGNTGYMGIHLTDMNGFPKQIVQLTVRCNKQLSGGSYTENETTDGDSSFRDHDQFMVYFNPGGSDAPVVKFLDQKNISAFDMYEETVVRTQETDMRGKLKDDLSQMRLLLNTIQEKARRVEADGIVVPDMPRLIKGDTIIAKKGNETLTLDRDMWKDSKDNRVTEDELTYYLQTETTVSQGFNLDWQDGTIRDGYLEALVPDGNYVAYFVAKQGEPASNMSTTDIKWRYKDGKEFVFDMTSTDPTGVAANINNDIQGLINAWQSYYNLKATYQKTDVRDLLLLELDALDAGSNWTKNDSSNVILLY